MAFTSNANILLLFVTHDGIYTFSVGLQMAMSLCVRLLCPLCAEINSITATMIEG